MRGTLPAVRGACEVAQPGVPVVEVAAVPHRERHHPHLRVEAAGRLLQGGQVEVDVRQQVGLVDHHQVGDGEHVRVLQWLVVALGHRDDHDLGWSRRGRTAPGTPGCRRSRRTAASRPAASRRGQRAVHHVGVEVAPRPGVDLDRAGAGAGDPLGVGRRLLVALDHADLAARAGLADGALEQGGLARARRAHQVDDVDAARAAAGPGWPRPARSFLSSTRSPSSRVSVVPRARGVRAGARRSWWCSCSPAVRTRTPSSSPQPQVRHMPPPSRRRPRRRRSSSPCTTATSALPHGQSRIRSGAAGGGSAGAAADPPGDLADLQPGTVEVGALAGEVEAEAHGVGHDAGERADLEPHAGDAPTRRAARPPGRPRSGSAPSRASSVARQ